MWIFEKQRSETGVRIKVNYIILGLPFQPEDTA